MREFTLAQQAPLSDFLQTGLFPLLIVGAIFYLLIFMPMRKRQKKLDALIASLKNGDKVITTSGIYGVVAGVKDTTFILKIADQVKVEVAKSAVADKLEEAQGS